MPITTKKKIAEQVLYEINGGMQSVTSPVQEEDVIEALGQLINTTFKMRHYTEVLPSGDTIPDGAMIATYENISTISMEGLSKSYSILPVMPISLPRNSGIMQISDRTDFQTYFIPLQPGQQSLLTDIPLINDLLGQIGYEPYKNRVVFSQDLTLIKPNMVVHMRLVVFEINQYADTDPLPIPADMESVFVNTLIKQFAPVTGKMKVSDIITQEPITTK